MKIAILTSVHPRRDTRIHVKQVPAISTLTEAQVQLYVMDGQGDEDAGGFKVKDVGRPPTSRLLRALLGNWRMWRACRRWKADIAHFHDPELILAGFALKLSGTKVIYDVHEDVPSQILSKHWIPSVWRRPIANTVSAVEWLAGRVFDGVFAATPTIAKRFSDSKTTTVQNFPVVDELASNVPWTEKHAEVCYVGGLGKIRGVEQMCAAIGMVRSEARLNLGGSFGDPRIESELRNTPGWSRVNALGWLDRSSVRNVLRRSVAGLVTLHPTVNYVDALPVKMFEYMAAGIPVIASDFPLWRDIVEGSECGLLVDPLDPRAIAGAIDTLVGNPDLAERMGRKGREAVEQKYNWDLEKFKLLAFYQERLL